MQQVADWLEKFGLGQYAHCFAENGIECSQPWFLLADARQPHKILSARMDPEDLREVISLPSPTLCQFVTSLPEPGPMTQQQGHAALRASVIRS